MKDLYDGLDRDLIVFRSGSWNKSTINVAGIACGSRRAEFLVMAKSVLLFSRDAPLHFIVFSDKGTILDVAQDVRLTA